MTRTVDRRDPPNWALPDYQARDHARARAAEQTEQERRAELRAQIAHLVQRERAEMRAAMGPMGWSAVQHLVGVTRALIDAGDHVPELLALREAAAFALQPFGDGAARG